MVLAMTASAQTGKKNVGTITTPAKQQGGGFGNPNQPVPTPATTDPDYVIGPEDMLHISVWKEPDLSGAVPVRPDGKISLPLLGDVQAAGTKPMQLSDTLAEKLKQYVTNPIVTVVVTGINSKRIFLVGEVSKNGAMNMLPNMTVLQALAAAGGFSQFANLKKIYILRNQNGRQIKIPINYKEIVKGQAPEQNILLKPNDTIVVP
jgi:polysaccharide export outer membrane protein